MQVWYYGDFNVVRGSFPAFYFICHRVCSSGRFWQWYVLYIPFWKIYFFVYETDHSASLNSCICMALIEWYIWIIISSTQLFIFFSEWLHCIHSCYVVSLNQRICYNAVNHMVLNAHVVLNADSIATGVVFSCTERFLSSTGIQAYN